MSARYRFERGLIQSDLHIQLEAAVQSATPEGFRSTHIVNEGRFSGERAQGEVLPVGRLEPGAVHHRMYELV